MIDVGTILTPRTPSDPVAKVVGLEPEQGRYILSPVGFGSPFALDIDGLCAAYDCSGYKVSIEPFNEAREWARLSSEKYHGKLTEVRRQAKQEASAESPEQVFKRLDAEAAAAKRK